MRRWWPVALVLAACGRGAHHDASSTATMTDAAITVTVLDARPVEASRPSPGEVAERELPSELRDAAPYGNDMKRAVCGKRKDCSIARQKSAGKAPSGDELVVVTARLAGGGDPEGPPTENREHWVIGKSGGTLAFRARIASEWVQTSNTIEETLELEPNALATAVRWWPTSSWQSWPRRTFRLWPPVMTSFEEAPQHIGDLENGGSSTMDLNAGSGDGSYRCAGGRRGDFLPIPAIRRLGELPPSRGLGACATDVNGSPHHGYMVKGASSTTSGHFRVALFSDTEASRGSLYIEAHDDHWTAGDELEIRMGRPAGFMACGDDLTSPRTYVIDSAGRVKPSTGLTVERVRDEGGVRLYRVTGEMHGISISQRDDDGDGTSPRVLATTPATSKELGDFSSIDDVACADTTEGPVLVPVMKKGQ